MRKSKKVSTAKELHSLLKRTFKAHNTETFARKCGDLYIDCPFRVVGCELVGDVVVLQVKLKRTVLTFNAYFLYETLKVVNMKYSFKKTAETLDRNLLKYFEQYIVPHLPSPSCFSWEL